MTIGQWVRRSEPGRKWHLCESVVNEAAVTHCGRRMKAPLEESDVMPLTRMIDQPQLCKVCQ